MKILMVSKASVVGAYQRKLEKIAAHSDVELTVAVPAAWRDERGRLPLERAHTRGYQLVVEPIALNGSFHLHFYPRLARRIRTLQPDIVHLDEEPYNLATWLGLRQAQREGAKALFFSWQNIARQYPWPFGRIEAEVLRRADFAICGNAAAVAVWRAKGYRGDTAIIPQFGVDPDLYPWREPQPGPENRFAVGFVGRLVRDKGVDLLLEAFAALPETARLEIIGSGPEQRTLRRQVAKLGLAARARFVPWLPSHQMAARLREMDVLVLPSRSSATWKEQFGRVLIEAMASGVPVVGSTCGEIPNVIGDAGVVFPEGDAGALRAALVELYTHFEQRARFALLGRERVLQRFTQARIAAQTVQVYERMLHNAPMV